MNNNDWKERLGVVYSTSSDFKYTTDATADAETLAADAQNLRVWLDTKSRAGKRVTLVKGFVGSADDLTELARLLKTKLGVGGSAKDGEVIIQGDFRDRVTDILLKEGYKRTKKIG